MDRLPFHVNLIHTLLLLLILIMPVSAGAEDNREAASSNRQTPWSLSMQGGSVYQFDTDLDEQGGFSINRFFIQGGPVYSPGYRRSIGLTVGYGFDRYDFTEESVFPNQTPWEDIHNVRLGVPVRWGTEKGWTVFILPSVRFTAESGADWHDALTGGVFGGASYRFSDRLTVGPGIGIMSQLEDNATIFPLLLIEWKITGRLSLSTGPVPAATQGPGLILDWRPADRWHLLFGGRYEKQRFRLDEIGGMKGGIGENTSLPLFTGATCEFTGKTRASLIAGVQLGGELRQEDRNGNLIAEQDYDPAFFLGVYFSGRI